MSQEEIGEGEGEEYADNAEAIENSSDYENSAEMGNELDNYAGNNEAMDGNELDGNELNVNDGENGESANLTDNSMPNNVANANGDDLNADYAAEDYSEDSTPPAADEESTQMPAGAKRVMYIAQDMVPVFSAADQSSTSVGNLSAGDPVLAEVVGSFAKIGEARYVTLDSLSDGIVGRTPTRNPWK